MTKEIYINVSILDYGNGIVDCHMAQQVDDGELEITKLDLNHARKLMWEVVLAGGRRDVRINSLDRNIVCRDAYIFLPS